MPGFSKVSDGFNGRRWAPRLEVLVSAATVTRTGSGFVELLNISCTGAKLRATHLPAQGHDVLLKAEQVEAFGVVVWKRGNLCGVAFDKPLNEFQLHQLRRESHLSSLANQTPAERQAAEDWSSGFTR